MSHQSTLPTIQAPDPQIILSAGAQNDLRPPSLSNVFYCLSHVERKILYELLCQHEHSIEDLIDMTYGHYQGIRKQLIVLEECGLITSFKDGKYRFYHATPYSLDSLYTWIKYKSYLLKRL